MSSNWFEKVREGSRRFERVRGGSMMKMRAVMRFLFEVLMRVVKRLAAPGAGPKVVSG
jgi:hypothetical protein